MGLIVWGVGLCGLGYNRVSPGQEVWKQDSEREGNSGQGLSSHSQDSSQSTSFLGHWHTIRGSPFRGSFRSCNPAYKNENIWEFQGGVVGDATSRALALSQPRNLLLLHSSSSHSSPTSHHHPFARTRPVGNFPWGGLRVLWERPLDGDHLQNRSAGTINAHRLEHSFLWLSVE